VDQVKELDGELGLVRLEVSHQVPSRQAGQGGDLLARLLDPVLAEDTDSSGDGLANDFWGNRLADRHQSDRGGLSPDPQGSDSDPFLYPEQAVPNTLSHDAISNPVVR
jgi:hypothetical protein